MKNSNGSPRHPSSPEPGSTIALRTSNFVRILIVDDEPDILMTLEKVLTGEGYNVVCVGGGGRANLFYL